MTIYDLYKFLRLAYLVVSFTCVLYSIIIKGNYASVQKVAHYHSRNLSVSEGHLILCVSTYAYAHTLCMYSIGDNSTLPARARARPNGVSGRATKSMR